MECQGWITQGTGGNEKGGRISARIFLPCKTRGKEKKDSPKHVSEGAQYARHGTRVEELAGRHFVASAAFKTGCSLFFIYSFANIHFFPNSTITTPAKKKMTLIFVRQWRRLSLQLKTNIVSRRKSTSSTKSNGGSSSTSSKSSKSVRFQAIDSIYYTHSSAEYDRTPAPEEHARPMLGQLFIDEDDVNDQILVKNTNLNRQRSLQSIATHIALRAMR